MNIFEPILIISYIYDKLYVILRCVFPPSWGQFTFNLLLHLFSALWECHDDTFLTKVWCKVEVGIEDEEQNNCVKHVFMEKELNLQFLLSVLKSLLDWEIKLIVAGTTSHCTFIFLTTMIYNPPSSSNKGESFWEEHLTTALPRP